VKVTDVRRLVTWLVCGAVAVAGPAAAQNLIENPEFDAGSAGWQVQTGTLELVADSGGCLLSQAIEAASASTGSIEYIDLTSDTCVAVDGSVVDRLEAGGMYRTGAAVWARLYLQLFTDDACLQHLGWSAVVAGGTAPVWERISGPITLTPETRSVRLHVGNNPMVADEPPYTVEWDRLYLGAVPELFVDGFEVDSGSACRWSSLLD
jgi:hypothetical protein